MKNNLRTLEILFYIYGALQLLAALFLLLLSGGFSMFMNSDLVAEQANGDVAPAVVGTVMGIVFGAIAFFVLVVAVLNILAARNIGKRKGRTLVMIAAGLDCLSFPVGTALGIFTFVELSKDDVKTLFSN